MDGCESAGGSQEAGAEEGLKGGDPAVTACDRALAALRKTHFALHQPFLKPCRQPVDAGFGSIFHLRKSFARPFDTLLPRLPW